MDNYCFFRLLDDGLPSYFSYLYPSKEKHTKPVSK